jgi:ABC-type dipeptide/oligopeptide/nickel transport system ATPase component
MTKPMDDLKPREIAMPPNSENPEGRNLSLKGRVLVVVGANGAGKTRFGVWLEKNNSKIAHRVSAHRSLDFPERVSPTDIKEAERMLLSGRRDEHQDFLHRAVSRWGQRPETALLNDFEHLVTYLVSENFAVSDAFRQEMRKAPNKVAPPKTRFDLVKEIWESILPSRELISEGSRIEARDRKAGGSYHPREMSDGERGLFHLIGEALSVPAAGIFIVDEPELHLHRAIQARLWDAVERARPDCTFVYITHDLGFAASRADATKVWLRSYTSGKWEWQELPETADFPDAVLFELVGSRFPVLFVEGTRNSLDYFLYRKVYPTHTVMPCGSCESVIHSTRSFKQMEALHHNQCAGLVDNDGRGHDDLNRLSELGIAATPVALVENLFLLESVLAVASKRLGCDADAAQKIKERVFQNCASKEIQIVSTLTRQEIEQHLRTFGSGADGVEALDKAYLDASSRIDPREIYSRWEAEIRRVIAEKDYLAALRYYTLKGLPAEAGSVFGVKYPEIMLRWLGGDCAEEFFSAFRAALPKI